MSDNDVLLHVEKLNENPHVLAKRAISLLEQRIYKDFGLKVLMAAELEFTLVPRDGTISAKYIPEPVKFSRNIDDNPKSAFSLTRQRIQNSVSFISPDRALESYNIINRIPSLLGLLARDVILGTDPFLPHSPYVCYSYQEGKKNQYEVVISHMARHDTLPPDGKRSLTFARAIEALRNTFETAHLHKRAFSRESIQHQQALGSLVQQWRPVFDGFLSKRAGLKERTHGLHINMSFVTEKDRQIISLMDKKQIKAFCRGISSVMNEGTYLTIANQSSRDRFARCSRKKDYLSAFRYDGGYFELRSPAANSDPYYATMLALASLYYTLEKGSFNLKTNKLSTPDAIPNFVPLKGDVNFMDAFLNGDRRIISTLNQVEKSLGDRFESAIRKNPLEHNKSGQDRLPQR